MRPPIQINSLVDQLFDLRTLLNVLSRKLKLGVRFDIDKASLATKAFDPTVFTLDVRRDLRSKTIVLRKAGEAILACSITADSFRPKVWVLHPYRSWEFLKLALAGKYLPRMEAIEAIARLHHEDKGQCPQLTPCIFATGVPCVKVLTFDANTPFERLELRRRMGTFYCYDQGQSQRVLGLAAASNAAHNQVTVALAGEESRYVLPSQLVWLNMRVEHMPVGFDPTVAIDSFMRKGARWVAISVQHRGANELEMYWVLDVIQFHENHVRPTYLQLLCEKTPLRHLGVGTSRMVNGEFLEDIPLLESLKVRVISKLEYVDCIGCTE